MKRAIAFVAIFFALLLALAAVVVTFAMSIHFFGGPTTLAIETFGGIAILAWLFSREWRA